MARSRHLLVVTGGLAAIQPAWSAAAILAASGQIAPGVLPSSTFGVFMSAAPINESGVTAISTVVAGRWGVWQGPAGGLTLRIRQGVPAVGSPLSGGQPIEFFGDTGVPRIGDDGTIVVSCGYQNAIGSAISGRGLFTVRNGITSLVARQGYPARALGGAIPFNVVYQDIPYVSELSSSGRYAFDSTLAGPAVNQTNSSAIWTGTGGSQELVVRAGQSAPISTGGSFSFVNRPAINTAGNIAFFGSVVNVGTLITSSNDSGLWRWNRATGELGLVAREGNAAPGTGGVFGQFGRIAINAVDQVAFTATLTPGPSSDQIDAAGIWTGSSDGTLTQAVAVRGAGAPGAPGTSFGTFDNPAFVSIGSIAFRATLSGASNERNSGIWARTNGGPLTLVAREGDPAPGCQEGVLFAGAFVAGAFENFTAPMMNSAGDVAFSARLTGASVNGSNDEAIFLRRGATGITSLYVREGDFVADDAGVLRQISALSFGGYGGYGGGLAQGSANGQFRFLNVAGQLSYYATLDDGRTLLLTHRRGVVIVPEPGALLVISIGAALVLNRNRHVRFVSGGRQ